METSNILNLPSDVIKLILKKLYLADKQKFLMTSKKIYQVYNTIKGNQESTKAIRKYIIVYGLLEVLGTWIYSSIIKHPNKNHTFTIDGTPGTIFIHDSDYIVDIGNDQYKVDNLMELIFLFEQLTNKYSIIVYNDSYLGEKIIFIRDIAKLSRKRVLEQLLNNKNVKESGDEDTLSQYELFKKEYIELQDSIIDWIKELLDEMEVNKSEYSDFFNLI